MENKQGEREEEMTGVYKAQCAGDRRQVHLHGNEETGERVLIHTNKWDAFDIFCLNSAGGGVHCLIILCKEKWNQGFPKD